MLPRLQTWAIFGSLSGNTTLTPVKTNDSDDFSPPSPPRGDWIPWSLQLPFQLIYVFFCLIFIAVVEVLLRWSKQNGGFDFGSWIEVVPTVVSVMFALVWSIPDHHVKRLEPYYQLSKPDGAKARNSILLEYTYNFALFVPFYAIRRRHWAVATSALAYLWVTYTIAPLVAAFITFDQVERVQLSQGTRLGFMPLEDQQSSFTPGFGFAAADYIWSQKQKILSENEPDLTLPDFTTEMYAILPVLSDIEVEQKLNRSTKKQQSFSPVGDSRSRTRKLKSIKFDASLECQNSTIYGEKFNGSETVRYMYLSVPLPGQEAGECRLPVWQLLSQNTTEFDVYKGVRIFNVYEHHASFVRTPNQTFFAQSNSTFWPADNITEKGNDCVDSYKFLGIWNTWPFQGRERDSISTVELVRAIASAKKLPLRVDENTGLNATSYLETASLAAQAFSILDDADASAPYISNWTAILCNPVYHEQEIEVEYKEKSGKLNGEPLNVRPLGERKRIAPGQLDTAVFETMMVDGRTESSAEAMGINDLTDPDLGMSSIYARQWADHVTDVPFIFPFGFPHQGTNLGQEPIFQAPVAQIQKLFNFKAQLGTVTTGPQSLASYMIARLNKTTMDSLDQPEALAKAYSDMYALMFSFAVSLEYTSPASLENNPTNTPVEIREQFGAYVCNEFWARLLQASLAVMAVLVLALLPLITRRDCHLGGQPGSILDVMGSIADSPRLMRDLKGAERVPGEMVVNYLRHSEDVYSLHPSGNRIERTRAYGEDERLPPKWTSSDKNEKGLTHERPIELDLVMGTAVMIAMVSIIVILVVLYRSDQMYIGLVLGSDDEFLRSFVWAYIPMVAAMLLQAYITKTAKYVGLVATYQTLHEGYASHESLSVNYETSPILFQLPKSIKNKHYLLAFTITSAWLASVLAIAFGGLFPQDTTYPVYNLTYDEPLAPAMQLSSLEEYLNMPHFSAENNHTVVQMLTSKEGNERYMNATKFDADFLPLYSLSGEGSTDDLNENSEAYRSAYAYYSGNRPLPRLMTEDIFFLPFNPVSEEEDLNEKASLRELNGTLLGISSTIKCTALDKSNITPSHVQYTVNRGDGDTHVMFIAPGETCDSAVLLSRDSSSGDFGLAFTGAQFAAGDNGTNLHLLLPKNRPKCRGSFFASWSVPQITFHDVDQHMVEEGSIEAGSKYAEVNYTHGGEHLILSCDTSLVIGKYLTVLQSPGEYSSINSSSTTLLRDITGRYMTPTAATDLISLFQRYISTRGNFATGTTRFRSYETRVANSKPTTWFTYLMHLAQPAMNSTYPPPADIAIKAAEEVYKTQFVFFLERFQTQLFPARDKSTIEPGAGTGSVTLQAQTEEIRTTVSYSLFIISVIILIFWILVTVCVYILKPGNFMTQLPTNLALHWTTMAASTLLKELAKTTYMDADERPRFVEQLGYTYGYGWFYGSDGERHVGIEKEPLLRGEEELERQWDGREDSQAELRLGLAGERFAKLKRKETERPWLGVKGRAKNLGAMI